MKHLLCAVTIVLLAGGVANADVNTGGSLALTGEVEGSIAFFFFSDPVGYVLGGEGTANASMDIGPVSAYTPNGLLANKFTKTLDADGFHVTTPFLLQVLSANVPSSTSFRLTANLGENDGTVWMIDAVVLSTTPALISASEPYTTKRQHVVYAKFAFTRPAGSLSDTITFTATAN